MTGHSESRMVHTIRGRGHQRTRDWHVVSARARTDGLVVYMWTAVKKCTEKRSRGAPSLVPYNGTVSTTLKYVNVTRIRVDHMMVTDKFRLGRFPQTAFSINSQIYNNKNHILK